VSVTRTSTGLVGSDDFNRAAPGANWTIENGALSIVANRLRPDGADGRGRFTGIADRNELVLQALTNLKGNFLHPGGSVAGGITARHRATGDFYYVQCQAVLTSFVNSLNLFKRIGGGFTLLANAAMHAESDEDFTIKLHVKDNSQRAWVIDATGVHSAAAADAALNGLAGSVGYRRDQGPDPSDKHTDFDNYIICANNSVIMTGLPAGYKLRVGTRVAVEVGGTATVDVQEDVFPRVKVEVLTAADVPVDELAPVDGVWGGDSYDWDGTPGNAPPAAPTVTVDNVTDTAARFTKSAFSDPDAGDTQAAFQFEVRRTSDNVVVHTTAEIAGAGNVHQLAAATLVQLTEHQVRGRQKDNRGTWSAYGAWSAPFTTLGTAITGMVIVASNPAGAIPLELQAALEELLYAPVIISDALALLGDFTGADLVIFSESALLEAAQLAIRAQGVPILTTNGAKLRMWSSALSLGASSPHVYATQCHPIHYGLASPIQVFTGNAPFVEFVPTGGTVAGTLIGRMRTTEGYPYTDSPIESVLEAGELDTNGDAVPARLAALGWLRADGVYEYSAAGKTLIGQAVEWLLDSPDIFRLKAVAFDFHGIALSWVLPGGTRAHKLYRSTDPAVPATAANLLVDLGDNPPNPQEYQHTGMAQGTTVYYRLEAVRISDGATISSSVACATTPTAPAPSFDVDDVTYALSLWPDASKTVLYVNGLNTDHQRIYFAIESAGMTALNYEAVGTLFFDGVLPAGRSTLEHSGLVVGERYFYILVGYDLADEIDFETAVQSIIFGYFVPAASAAGPLLDASDNITPDWFWQFAALYQAVSPQPWVAGRFNVPFYQQTPLVVNRKPVFMGIPNTAARDGYVRAAIMLDPNHRGAIWFYPWYGQEGSEFGVGVSVIERGDGSGFLGIWAAIVTGTLTPYWGSGFQSAVLVVDDVIVASFVLPEPVLMPWWPEWMPHGYSTVLELDVVEDPNLDPQGNYVYHCTVRAGNAVVIQHDVARAARLECANKTLMARTFGGGALWSGIQATGTDDGDLVLIETVDGMTGWVLGPGSEVDVYALIGGEWVYQYTTTEDHIDVPWSRYDYYGDGLDILTQLALGAGGEVYREAVSGEVGEMGEPLLLTAEIAPAGLGGEAEFSTVYITSRNLAIAGYLVTPIVNGKRLTPQGVLLEASPNGEPIVRVKEIPLYELDGTRSWLPVGTFVQLLITMTTIRLETASGCGIATATIGVPFPELLGAEIERTIIREAFPSVAFTPELLAETSKEPLTALAIATGGELMLAESGVDDDGTAVQALARSDDVLPAGEGGECEFSTLYIAFARSNSSNYTIEIERIVDGVVLGAAISLVLPGVAAPVADVFEVPLEENRAGASYYPRGAAFAFRVKTIGPLPDGLLIVLGGELEFNTVRESVKAHYAS
jgi:hypothetical protein